MNSLPAHARQVVRNGSRGEHLDRFPVEVLVGIGLTTRADISGPSASMTASAAHAQPPLARLTGRQRSTRPPRSLAVRRLLVGPESESRLLHPAALTGARPARPGPAVGVASKPRPPGRRPAEYVRPVPEAATNHSASGLTRWQPVRSPASACGTGGSFASAPADWRRRAARRRSSSSRAARAGWRRAQSPRESRL